MVKKRFLVAILLVILIVMLSSEVLSAGCCVGSIGCTDGVFFESACSELQDFEMKPCEEIQACDIVACCHEIPEMPKANYRITCVGMEGDIQPIYIKPFDMNPADDASIANQICAGAKPSCPYVNCEQENSANCLCGSALTSSTSKYCCSKDQSVFPTFGACTSSPSCRATTFFSIHGTVKSPDGWGIEGVDVSAGPKNAITDSEGRFTISLLPDQSSGTVTVMKNNIINSASYTIDGEDITEFVIILDIPVTPPEGAEICGNNRDDDGDQFFWESDLADKCDPDCNHIYTTRQGLLKTVTLTYYRPVEFDAGQDLDKCSDNFDNDCDGFLDCNDVECIGTDPITDPGSPACQDTYCGDAVIQFPNAEGVYEQCDYYDETGLPKRDESGNIIGNDSLCPGNCIEPGETKECTCKYTPGCGNGVIDAPLEDCDGMFLNVQNIWDPANFNPSSECSINECGKPDDLKPCKCLPPQICGDGQVNAPEGCDPGGALIDGVVADAASGNCEGCSPDCTCPVGPGICGNNILEGDEDCDGIVTANAADWGDLWKYRKYGCTKDRCAIPKLEPGSAPFYIGPGGSEHGNDYTAYDTAYSIAYDGRVGCTCPTTCNELPPGPVVAPVKGVSFRREIEINWTDECVNENAQAYNVLRCTTDDIEGTGCDPDDEDSVYIPLNAAPLGVVNSFVDTEFEGSPTGSDRYYCYKVEGIYSELIHPPDTVQQEDWDASIHCVRAGNEGCFDFNEHYPWAEEFCYGNVRSTCSEDNLVVDVTSVFQVDCNIDNNNMEFMCVGPYGSGDAALAGKTQCVAKSICQYCNNPFGIFGASSTNGYAWGRDAYNLLGLNDFGRAPSAPPSDQAKQTREGYINCADLPACYLDYTYTNVNKFYTMSEESTCYDFHSQEACRKFNATDHHCEWIPHSDFAELGIGVCRTNLTEQQECGRCHDPENEIFGRCSKNSCMLYGRCYFDKASLPGESDLFPELANVLITDPKRAQQEGNTHFYRCTHEIEVSCQNYDEEKDCIASDSPFSKEGSTSTQFAADVLWNTDPEVFMRTGDTNSIVQESDDFFGFGKCQWGSLSQTHTTTFDEEGSSTTIQGFSARCFKNSDDAPVIETVGVNTPANQQVNMIQSADCYNGWSEAIPVAMDCMKDITNPVTLISHYANETDPQRIAANFTIMATVNDRSTEYAETYYPTTFACIAKDGMSCYPNGTADFVSHSEGNKINNSNIFFNVDYDISEGAQSGWHWIRYYSEDVSHNLEEVRDFRVYLDADPPNVTFEFANISYERAEDVWRTNLTLTMGIFQMYEEDEPNAVCSAEMYLADSHIYPSQDVKNEYNNSWVLNYTGMPDNIYSFRYRCLDSVGNVAEGEILLKIEGDMSVTNPQPMDTFNSSTITISVDTGLNGECRYLYSPSDDPRFWDNVTFNAGIFDSMTLFSTTGAETAPMTHHSSDVTLGHGFHRYYVKCKIFADVETGKIRGNSADQIIFAIDQEPPVTMHSVDASPYNGWYNRDIAVHLHCGDPALEGLGRDWSFGCSSSHYCEGEDCSSGLLWEEYGNYIGLDETTHLTYFSKDIGDNAEVPVENELFQIDKVPPNITIELLDGSTTAGFVVLNVMYKVRVSSDKPFISPALDEPSLIYSSSPSKFSNAVELLPTTDPSVWEGMFFMENINANRGFEGLLTFTAEGIDYHNVTGTGSMTIVLDTKPPAAPVLEPSLEDPSKEQSEFQALGYPVHYHNGTYYVRGDSIFLTGYTEELLDVIAVTTIDDKDSEYTFMQTPTSMEHEDTVLAGLKWDDEVRIIGNLQTYVDSGMYIGFNTEQTTMGPKETYGSYGMFYDVTGLAYDSAEEFTSVAIDSGLEDGVNDKSVFFYDTVNPTYWFGFNLSLAMFKNTTFYMKSYDEVGNRVRYPRINTVPSYLTFFADTVSPQVVNHYPLDGSTSQVTFDISVIVKEGTGESGLFNNSVDFLMNGHAVTYSIERAREYEALDPNSRYHKIYHSVDNLDDGDYNIAVEGTDLALNPFNEDSTSSHWTFNIDRNVPANPYFELIGGFSGPPGDDRWYVTKSPDFIVDFSAEPNDVTLVDIIMESTPTEGEAADCTETEYNIFYCKFATPKTTGGMAWMDYGVIIKAYKILDDKTQSNTGTYGPFKFTVDDQAPDYTLAFQTRFMDNINLTLFAWVKNERHSLYADLEVLGQHYKPLYTSGQEQLYYFVWNVPDYKKVDEGNTSMKVTLSDFAGNKRSVTIPVYIDLTAPRIANLTIGISNTVEIGTELFTSYPSVVVSGTLIDDDIDRVWVYPGDFNETTGVANDKKLANITYVDGKPDAFTVSVKLPDPSVGGLALSPIVYSHMLINHINNMSIFASDIAGHISRRDLQVITDITPPSGPLFCLGEDWTKCLPPSLIENGNIPTQ
ncbi:carboxypeptidase-like regulatory domain-containing protein [Nanoarchaeota archaeon]